MPGVGVHLEPAEAAIQQVFIPALLAVKSDSVNADFRQLLANGVKQCGLNIRDLSADAERLHQCLSEASVVLSKLMNDDSPLDYVAHKQCIQQVGTKARKERVESEVEFVESLPSRSSKVVKKRLERMGKTVAWLTVMPNLLNGTLLSAEEWRDNARLRYGLWPVGLCDRCDRCNAPFTIHHAISCKKGGSCGSAT